MEGTQGFSLCLLLCEPLQCIGEIPLEFCVREGASGSQLPIQQIDLTLPRTQLPVLRRYCQLDEITEELFEEKEEE
jgi:hypothetical protein